MKTMLVLIRIRGDVGGCAGDRIELEVVDVTVELKLDHPVDQLVRRRKSLTLRPVDAGRAVGGTDPRSSHWSRRLGR